MQQTKQVDGDHYTKLKIPPFEYSYANNLDCYQHTAIKYITRFRNKNGKLDLEKALDVIAQLIEAEYGPTKPLTDNQYEVEALTRLAQEIQPDHYTQIITTGRGGLWAAANLAYALNISEVSTVTQSQLEKLNGSKMLFVDGIVDTGKTIANLKIDAAALFVKTSAVHIPLYAGKIIDTGEYFALPISQMFDKENHAFN